METNDSQSIGKFLTAGIIAGPFFVVVAFIQAFTREGFSIVKHPASMLSLGDGGWIQISNFVFTGILFILSGIGLRKVLTSGIGMKWVSRLFIIYGIALVLGGVFTADQGLGFPPGAPEGVAKEMSFHGAIHAFAPILGFVSQMIALFILARRFGSQNYQGWKVSTIIAAIVMFLLAILPNFTADWEKGVFNFIPLWIGTSFGLCWTSLVIAKVKSEVV